MITAQLRIIAGAYSLYSHKRTRPCLLINDLSNNLTIGAQGGVPV